MKGIMMMGNGDDRRAIGERGWGLIRWKNLVIICVNGTGQKTKMEKASLHFSPHGWLFDSSTELMTIPFAPAEHRWQCVVHARNKFSERVIIFVLPKIRSCDVSGGGV